MKKKNEIISRVKPFYKAQWNNEQMEKVHMVEQTVQKREKKVIEGLKKTISPIYRDSIE